MSPFEFPPDGMPEVVTDPRGIKAKTIYDLLGQTTETIAAWDGTSSPTPTSSTNQMTLFTWDGDGDQTSMTAVLPSGQPSQTTGLCLWRCRRHQRNLLE